MPRCIFFLWIATWIGTAGIAAADVGALDGRSYCGSLKGQSHRRERYALAFRYGRFCSTACNLYGYSESDYSANRRRDGVEFQARTRNGRGETMAWHGVARGRSLTATATIGRPFGRAEERRFTGHTKCGKKSGRRRG